MTVKKIDVEIVKDRQFPDQWQVRIKVGSPCPLESLHGPFETLERAEKFAEHARNYHRGY